MLRFGLLLSVVMALLSCRSPAERLARPPELELPGQGKCSVGGAASHPLVVEWAAAERASLEARLARGLVAVRAEGCNIEVLRQCDVRGDYSYLGLTRKNDRVKIRNADELYAQLPLGAARLEAKLARSGELDVEIALVGMLEAPEGRTGRDALKGDCEAATHVITGVQVGAFRFLAGATGEIKAGGSLGQAGAGVSSTAERETLSADGQPAQCDASTTLDERPPEGCGALIRIELTALPGPGPAVTVSTPCPVGSRWEGDTCVVVPGSVPAPVTTPTQTPTPTTTPTPALSGEALLCKQLCDRQFACQEESSGIAGPEGAARARIEKRCRRVCEFMVTDWNRAQMRKCVGMTSCDAFAKCVGPADADF